MRKIILAGSLAGVWLTAFCHAASGQCGVTYSNHGTRYSYTPSYSYATPTYSAPAYKETATVYKEVQYTKFVPVVPVALIELAVLPTYSAQYVPPVTVPPSATSPANAHAAAPQGDLAKILAAIGTIDSAVKLIDQRLTRLEGPTPAAPKQMAPAPKGQTAPAPQPQETQQTALQIVQAKCSQCHSPETKGFGGGFVMIDDNLKLKDLTAEAKNDVLGHASQNTMPPARKPKGFAGELPTKLTDLEAAVLTAYYTGRIPAEYDARKKEVSDDKPLPRVVVRARK